MTQLRAYLSEHGIRQEDFAAQLGTSQSTVSKVVAGRLTPTLRLAVKIEQLTCGLVPVKSWVADVAMLDSTEGDAA